MKKGIRVDCLGLHGQSK